MSSAAEIESANMQVPESVESEDLGEERMPVKPWDPKKIRITTKTFTVREVFAQIKEDELNLAPDFQRSFVWKERQQVRLIESILLGIPLPAFYFNQDSSGEQQVIDGVQRLTTIKLFMDDKLVLSPTHLEYLNLGGVQYSNLDPPVRRRFAATQIVAHVIESQTPDEVKYDIFNRVNTGGTALTAQEIRHCMSKPRSRSFLSWLVERESFDKATCWTFWRRGTDGSRVRDNLRMANREMALRFCAFRNLSLDTYAQSVSLDAFLLDFTRRLDDVNSYSDQELQHMGAGFERAMQNAVLVLGDGAFRRWPPGAPRRGPINRAVFESQALALADYETQQVKLHCDEVEALLRKLFNDATYDSSVRSGTGDPRKLACRINMPKVLLAEFFK